MSLLDHPEPGEVWVLTNREYLDRWGEQARINGSCGDGPFIVTGITVDRVWYVYAGSSANGDSAGFVRGYWDWNEQMTRIWPPVPTWDQLQEARRHPGDLRAQHRDGKL